MTSLSAVYKCSQQRVSLQQMVDKMLNDVDREQSIGIDLNCLEVSDDPRVKAFFQCLQTKNWGHKVFRITQAMAEQFDQALLPDSLCLNYPSLLFSIRVGNALSKGLVMHCCDGQLQPLAEQAERLWDNLKIQLLNETPGLQVIPISSSPHLCALGLTIRLPEWERHVSYLYYAHRLLLRGGFPK